MPNGGAKLTEKQVRSIHARAAQGESRPDLAKEFGVTPLTISNITRVKKWKHLGLTRIRSTGEHHPKTRLTAADIPVIYRRLQAGDSIEKVAGDYKVGRTCIANVWHGRTWKNVPRPVARVRAWE